MDYYEYRDMRARGMVAIGVGKNAAQGWVTYLPTPEKTALAFWKIIQWGVLLGGIGMLFVSWPIGLLMLVIGFPLISSANSKSVQQAVLAHAHENEMFFKALVANGDLHFKYTREMGK
jgi:hypothetical protein